MTTGLSHTVESSFISDVKRIVEEGRRAAYETVSAVMIETYWHIGRRIVEQEQNGQERAEYGTQLIEMLSKELTIAYGKGFSKRNLQYFRSFYLTFNDFQRGRLKSDFGSASFFSYFNRYTVLSSKISKFHFNRLQRSVSSPMLDVNKSVWERQF